MAIARLNDEGRESWGKFELSTAGSTHVGRIRKANQDAFDRFDDLERGEILLVVADGMGGHRGGEVASRMAVGTLGKLCHEGEGDPRFRLEHAIERANFEIHKLASKDRTLQGMGTTIVALLLCQEGNSFVAHVGDSRAYLANGSNIVQVTEDHTHGMDRVVAGELSLEEAQQHPDWHVMSNWLGFESYRVASYRVPVEPGDRLLLCTDGLSNMLADDQIAEILSVGTVERSAAVLIDAANDAGGADNITVVVVEVFEG